MLLEPIGSHVDEYTKYRFEKARKIFEMIEQNPGITAKRLRWKIKLRRSQFGHLIGILHSRGLIERKRLFSRNGVCFGYYSRR